MTNCEKCAPNKCSCDKKEDNIKICMHEKLKYCECCNSVLCKKCDEKWGNNYQYQVSYYPPIFGPAPYVPVTPCDPDPPFCYTTCECNTGD